MNRRNGFTLLELIIVVVVLWVIAMTVVWTYLPLQTDPLPPSPQTSRPVTQAEPETGPTMDELVAAIAQVESGGDPTAVGDGGAAVGLLQIHPIMVAECNRILGRKEYTLADRLDPERSVAMFHTYSDHWAAVRGGDFTAEGIARRWNGGPDGHTERSTAEYWARVREALQGK